MYDICGGGGGGGEGGGEWIQTTNRELHSFTHGLATDTILIVIGMYESYLHCAWLGLAYSAVDCYNCSILNTSWYCGGLDCVAACIPITAQ